MQWIVDNWNGCLKTCSSFLPRYLSQAKIAQIRATSGSLADFSNDKLRQHAAEVSYTASSDLNSSSTLIDSFALACESVRRHLGMVPYDVQLLAGIQLTRRCVVEMATGEGKTLSSLPPLFYFAIKKRGVLIATANDYLAERDSEFAATVLTPLGVSVGVVLDRHEDHERREAYDCDVTFGTASQFGFDFLRDRAKLKFATRNKVAQPPTKVQQRKLHSIIVDEIDSLLIDEAATPLMISSAPPEIKASQLAGYLWASEHADGAQEGSHFVYRKVEKKVELSETGAQWLNRLPKPRYPMGMIERREFIERAILVRRDFLREKHYIINDGKLVLVDQSTGRVGEGRQWSQGTQQAIQAKEGIPITMPNGQLARVTLQSFFNSFEFLSGMTGTAASAASEFESIYKLPIFPIPTHRVCQRAEYPALGFLRWKDWLEEIVQQVREMSSRSRSVLIGTRSIRMSELVSSSLTKAGLEHMLLNAKNDADEASIVSDAGLVGRVTVATHMAGRGTDIKLSPAVKEAGGLHVILAGLHESKRVDRQLIGRSGRQGDPGSYQVLLCLEDDLLDLAFAAEELLEIRQRLTESEMVAAVEPLFQKAQRLLEKRQSNGRRLLFHAEKTRLKHLARVGLDPLLDLPE